MIQGNRNKLSIDWRGEGLTDDDAATIAYYLLKDNKVSN